jgi:hypothetical protein
VAKRELIQRGSKEQYIRRDAQGQFTEYQVDKGRSDAANRRSSSHTHAPKGEGDKGKTTR